MTSLDSYENLLMDLVHHEFKTYRVKTKNSKQRHNRHRDCGYNDGREYRLSTMCRDEDGIRVNVLRVEHH